MLTKSHTFTKYKLNILKCKVRKEREQSHVLEVEKKKSYVLQKDWQYILRSNYLQRNLFPFLATIKNIIFVQTPLNQYNTLRKVDTEIQDQVSALLCMNLIVFIAL